ncbi:MAG: NnrS family protein, partial [Bryobacteraceae bacterium]|nr:NnrS family protein [Bryobacteraceae bacterium]
YPWFARAAFGWLGLSAVLGIWADAPGFTGASRHAFTVGFMATLILSIGPRILPSFLNSRELWSRDLMLVSLALISLGCLLRVSSEPLAYFASSSPAWTVLPVSALLELAALALFAVNIGRTLATPVPAWFGREQVKDTMPLYWYVTSYPATRSLLIEAGLRTLARAREVPKSLTLREAVEADGADLATVLDRLGDFFESRMARALRTQRN